MSRASSRRGLIITALLLFLVLALLDLIRHDSFLRRSLSGGPDGRTPLEQGIQEIRRTRGGSLRR